MYIFISRLLLLISIVFVLFIGYILIYKRNDINMRDVVIILLCIMVLAVYYFPSSNILKRYEIDSIRISGDSIDSNHNEDVERRLANQKDVQKIVDTINRFKFYRSAYRTISDVNLSNDAVSISFYMHDHKESKFIYLYITEDNSDLNLLKIDNQSYNVIEHEDLSRELMEQLQELESKKLAD